MNVSGDRLMFYVSRIFSLEGVEERVNERAQPQITAEEEIEILAEEIAVFIEEHEIADAFVEVTEEGVRITLSNISFLADSAVLQQADSAKINDIAEIISAIPDVRLYIAGHSTDIGAPEYLVNLSRDRAQSVANLLVSLGAVMAENVTVQGYGASRPVASNTTREGMAANRRVEITILEN